MTFNGPWCSLIVHLIIRFQLFSNPTKRYTSMISLKTEISLKGAVFQIFIEGKS